MNKLFQWNWGKGIVLVYACFVVGMLYLVFQSKQQKIDLVVDDYYQQELKFQQQIDASNRAVKAGVKARLVTHSGQQFLYLEGSENQSAKGTLLAYCAADKHKDVRMELHSTQTGRWLLPLQNLQSGKYIFKVHWEMNGESYYTELNYNR
jgi:hypothetical protein